ncbi:MAG: F0F1 ATP synthase subunit gamma, partial [Gammaproteobacteria bacterium]
MLTLEELQRVINTTQDLQSIVRTMKVLAAVSIRQYERAVISLREYRRTVDLGMQALAEHQRLAAGQGERRPAQGMGAIVFGSDHGLCGRFNEAITDYAASEIRKREIPAENRRLLTVGARAGTGMETRGLEPEECFFTPGSVAGITSTVRQIVAKLNVWQSEGIEEVVLFYNHHRSGAPSRPETMRLLPVRLNRFERLAKKRWPSRSLPCYTMSNQQLFSSLVRQYLFISIFRACAESLAGEHASR